MSDATSIADGISGILLAAGSSRRFGAANKLLAILDGKPLIRHAAETLAALALAELICVTGPDAEQVRQLIADLGFRFVHNERFSDGMGGSVATGIRAASADTKGAIVCLGDMPRLPEALLQNLIATFAAQGHDRIVFPSLPDGSQRNPVIWPARLFPELAALEGEQGAKAILKAHAGETIAIPAPEDAFLDIDTAAELIAQQHSSKR